MQPMLLGKKIFIAYKHVELELFLFECNEMFMNTYMRTQCISFEQWILEKCGKADSEDEHILNNTRRVQNSFTDMKCCFFVFWVYISLFQAKILYGIFSVAEK